LAFKEGARGGVQKYGTRSSLGISEPKDLALHLRPAQSDEFATTTSGKQQQPDDVGLLASRTASTMRIQSLVEAEDLGAGKEAGRLRSRISLYAACRIGSKEATGHGVAEDLPQYVQRPVRTARGRCAVGVEPEMYVVSSDAVQRLLSERR